MTHPFRFSASLGGLDTADLVTSAQRAEELGFNTVTLPDHFTDQPAPLIGLTAAAVATTTLRVLPLVLANDYREPMVLAKELASIDALSGGRLEFGLGAGWMITDYEQAGIRYDSPGMRIRRLSESVDILRALLAGDEVTIDSEFYSITGSLSAPLPVQAGLTAGVIDERAGRTATAEKTDQKLDWISDGAGTRLDSIELQTRIHLTMITDDRDKVAAELAPLLGITPDEALESPHALVGSTQQCIDEVQHWRDRWGISFVSIDGQDMEAFAPVVEALAGN